MLLYGFASNGHEIELFETTKADCRSPSVRGKTVVTFPLTKAGDKAVCAECARLNREVAAQMGLV